MAKTKKSAKVGVPQTEGPSPDPKTKFPPPADIHRLLSIPGPYDPPAAPTDWPGLVTAWDPGTSIQAVRKTHPALFYPPRWYEGEAFAKATDSWQWKQFRLTAVLPGRPFAEQRVKLPQGEELVTARELVTYLTVRFLTTGERLGGGWLRTRDVLPNGNRVIVGFGPLGFDIGACPDDYASPAVGLAAVFVPPVKRK